MNEPTYTINTILLKGELIRKYEEGRASQAVTPGMLVEKNLDASVTPAYGDGSFYRKHSTANGDAEALVALEAFYPADPSSAAGLRGTIDDDYATGDLMHLHLCQPGDVLYMWLSTSQTATMGSFLSSAGNGMLAVSTTKPLFHSMEVVTTTGTRARIKVRKL